MVRLFDHTNGVGRGYEKGLTLVILSYVLMSMKQIILPITVNTLVSNVSGDVPFVFEERKNIQVSPAQSNVREY